MVRPCRTKACALRATGRRHREQTGPSDAEPWRRRGIGRPLLWKPIPPNGSAGCAAAARPACFTAAGGHISAGTDQSVAPFQAQRGLATSSRGKQARPCHGCAPTRIEVGATMSGRRPVPRIHLRRCSTYRADQRWERPLQRGRLARGGRFSAPDQRTPRHQALPTSTASAGCSPRRMATRGQAASAASSKPGEFMGGLSESGRWPTGRATSPRRRRGAPRCPGFAGPVRSAA